MSARVDVRANRAQPSWSRRALAGRLLWAFCWPLFRCSPRPLWGWRRWLLRGFGARIGTDVHLYPTVKIMIPWHLSIGEGTAIGDGVKLYALGQVRIGARVTISQGAHLCAGSHDWRDPARPLLRLPITVADDAWVCAEAFVGPGVTIGAGAILGARAVAMADLAPGHIGRGNPMVSQPARDRGPP